LKENVISTEGGAFCRRSGETLYFALAFCHCGFCLPPPFSSTAKHKSHFYLPLPPTKIHVISTEGGALAAAVERPLYFAVPFTIAKPAFRQWQFLKQALKDLSSPCSS
jgi:hypothetical protein